MEISLQCLVLLLCLHFIFHQIELSQMLKTAGLLREKKPHGIAQHSSVYLTYNYRDVMKWTCDITLHGEVQVDCAWCCNECTH